MDETRRSIKEKKGIENFGIAKDEIPSFIDDIVQKISNPRRVQIEKKFKSINEFVAILYHFRFVEKLEKSEIANAIGMQVNPFHIHLYNFGWHYSNDYTKNKTLYDREISELLNVLSIAKSNAMKLDILKHPMLGETLFQKKNKIRNYLEKHFTSPEEYIKTMYHLVYIDCLTTVQIVILFNIPYHTIQLRLKTLGYKLNIKEAMQRKKDKKRQDYEKSLRSGKITRLNSRYETLSDSTKTETYARELLDKYAYDYFDSGIYDVLVGVNSIGLLNTKEVDIPVIIHDLVNDKFHKIVIEYNGDPYHDKIRDQEKINLAKVRGWFYISIIEGKNGYSSNNTKVIKRQVRQVCMELKKLVEGK